MKKFIDRPNLKMRAKKELEGDYRTAVPVTLIMLLLAGIPCALAGTGFWFLLHAVPLWLRCVLVAVIVDVVFLFLKGPLSYGRAKYYINMSRNEKLEVSQIVSGFNRWNLYGKTVAIKLLQMVYNLIGFILLIVPGIVMMYRYSMAFYIFADNPDLGVKECMKRSREMTAGNKAQLFALDLSYFWWYLLSVFTAGVLLLYVMPNVNTTKAYFYNVMAEKQRDIKPKVDRNYGEPGGAPIAPDGKKE